MFSGGCRFPTESFTWLWRPYNGQQGHDQSSLSLSSSTRDLATIFHSTDELSKSACVKKVLDGGQVPFRPAINKALFASLGSCLSHSIGGVGGKGVDPMKHQHWDQFIET